LGGWNLMTEKSGRFGYVAGLSRSIPVAALATVLNLLTGASVAPSQTALLSPDVRQRKLLSFGLRPQNRRTKFSLVKALARAEYFRNLPRKRMAAGVLLRDADGKVVLIEPSYKNTWEIPGGVVEMGESPWSAAERELEEELGLIRRDMQALVIDHVPSASDGTPEGLAWVFDGGLLSEAECAGLRGTDPEVRSVCLLEIDEVPNYAKESLSRRMRAALDAALAEKTNVYCEAGVPSYPDECKAVPGNT
jgi:8-oxo-dGTP pyrophosphatase MutT (NUDIX family)